MKGIAGQITDVRIVVGLESFRGLLPADVLGGLQKERGRGRSRVTPAAARQAPDFREILVVRD
jgi:hypothetical protein